MSKVFGKNNGRPNRVKRNAVDLSFRNNVTMNYGQLIPVMCKPVLPGDSVDFSIAAALRFMPTVFPLQTRQRLDLHAFYVRNRNLWKDWMDFSGMLKEGLVMPYLSTEQAKKVTTGSIYDYLGLATTVVGGGSSEQTSITLPDRLQYLGAGSNSFIYASSSSAEKSVVSVGDTLPSVAYNNGTISVPVNNYANVFVRYDSPFTLNDDASPSRRVTVTPPFIFDVSIDFCNMFDSVLRSIPNSNDCHCQILLLTSENVVVSTTPSFSLSVGPLVAINEHMVLSSGSSGYDLSNTIQTGIPLYLGFYFSALNKQPNVTLKTMASDLITNHSVLGFRFSASSEGSDSPVDFVDANKVNPYLPQNGSKVNTLRLRAYESIYNSFYRDDRNNPFLINGQPEYNKYIVSQEGGEDNFDYQIRYRHWEQDEFTTALPSPQQGVAPLVGISTTGVATFEDPDTGKQYNVNTVVADDGETITNFQYTENIPNSVARSLVNYATSGISINDFRNVNAFQRWKETNIRRGFKYRDQIKSHFDVDVSYAELDMPEFLGGTSIDVSVETVNQTSATEGSGDDLSPLGSYAGQMYAVGGSKNRIRKYFDEHGYLMVIASVVPVPVYTQTVDKDWYKSETLDYFYPEFGHIGLQAIPLRELAPVQSVNLQGADSLQMTFGYQRPWYDYLSSKDEAHGLFRTELNNFLLNRVFDNVPSLSPSFLLVDPEQLNNVFSVTDVSHKILGQIYFDMTFTRPIPMYGVPRLESNL